MRQFTKHWDGGARPRWNWRARARVTHASPFGVTWELGYFSERLSWGEPGDNQAPWGRYEEELTGALGARLSYERDQPTHVALFRPDAPERELYRWTDDSMEELEPDLHDLSFLPQEIYDWIVSMTLIIRSQGLEYDEERL